MRAKIENQVMITCEDVDLQELSGIEFYVRQGSFFQIYVPEVISAHEMVIVIPYADAMKLRSDKVVELQFAFTDGNGTPGATDVLSLYVRELLKEDGYDPV